MWYFLVNILCGLKSLPVAARLGVDWSVDTPQGSTLMQPFQAHEVLILRPVTVCPQPLVHGLENCIGLVLVWRTVLSEYFGNACCETVVPVVVGRAVGYSTAVVA